MAFGNATKGYVKAHAGGGGGGTADYEALLNKPCINGVELLGDKLVGSLSGNIQVKLSDIANTNLSNVQNAQTVLYNALSQKWENGAIPAEIEVIHYVGDDTRSRVHNVGSFKALKIFGIASSGYTESSFIVSPFTYYNADNNTNKAGTVTHGSGTIALNANDAGLEMNANGVDYYIVIIR